MTSGSIRDLEKLEQDIIEQSKKVNDLQHASISNGYSARGDEYDRKQKQAEKELDAMQYKYQKELNKASNILRNVK